MKNKRKILGTVLFHGAVLVLIVLSFSLNWARNNYGNIGFEEIVFHLNMPIKGTESGLLISYMKDALFPAGGACVVWFLFLYLPWSKRITLEMRIYRKITEFQIFPLRLGVFSGICFLGIWFLILADQANSSFGFWDYVINQFHQSKLIEEEYVDAGEVSIVFPERKRNLITIYVESAETTVQDRDNGGAFDENYIPEMTALAKEHISFSQSELLEGACVAPATGWTIAGLVAETSGLPLKLYKYDSLDGTDNSMGKYESFMPGATTLGDILEREGYYSCFMAGSNFKFGGRTSYFTQHGNYEIWDYKTAKKTGKIPKEYDVWWGFEDQKLYAFAKEKLVELASQEQPFNFAMITADSHHPAGYRCELCPNIWEEQYANVWSCTSAQLNEFIEWLKAREFYENTTVVVVGDHCSMDMDFYEDLSYDKHAGGTERKVYNLFINSAAEPAAEKNRQFTTLDIFPTTLASLGAEIEGDRLGLGTNLFSEQQTLSEKYGYEYFFAELDKKSNFYNNEILFP